MRGHLRYRYTPGAALTEAQLAKLWRLRVAVMTLKPHVDRDADRARFDATCRALAVVSWAEDAAGAPQAMAGTSALRTHGGPEGHSLVFLPEYVIAHPSARGTPALTRLCAGCILRCLRPGDLLRAWYGVGVGYPASWLFIARIGSDAWPDGHPEVPPRERAVLERAKQALGVERFDPRTGLVELPTLPPPLRAELEGTPLMQRYNAVNPRWREGWGVTGLARGDLRALVKLAARDLGRRRRPSPP